MRSKADASVKATGEPDQYIPCDILVVAIGQNIETDHFAEAGIPVERGKIVTTAGGDFLDMPGVFAGGDCKWSGYCDQSDCGKKSCSRQH